MANGLAGETSPYLLQHAHNPVDWQPWGDAALSRARREDKPIFLSIGYSACHWCHVMERESFEDPGTAALMNEHFVSIKVDREERPDLDDIYMKATQALSGHGGWPMSVWLTPELKPFYAGTYYPPTPRWGQPAFRQVLTSLAQAWGSQRSQVVAQAEKVTEHVARMALTGEHLPAPPEGGPVPRAGEADGAVRQLVTHFDREHGGFGSAPKFPHADDVRLLLRHHVSTADPDALHAAVHTLDAMARGGIYDQLGGGFSRYSTDERWWIPHFEKMLYDNALLVPAYLEAARITNRPDFLRVARECCEWVLREMTAPEGGLYSTQDADSEGEEGKFFAWDREEAHRVAGPEHCRLIDVAWNLGSEPNFEGRHWVLVRPKADAELAAELGLADAEALHAALAAPRAALLAARERRVHPATDDKVLVAWNGLMIGALAQAGALLEEPRFLQAARRAADFCLTTMRPDGRRLLATWRQGRAHLNGTLADYAYLGDGLLDLFEADGDARWAREALALARVADEHFQDERGTGWYFTSDDHERLITRPRDLLDGALPSSVGVMLELLVRLEQLTGDAGLRRAWERAMAALQPLFAGAPGGFARALLALTRADAAATVVLAGGAGEDGLRRALRTSPDASRAAFLVPAAGVDGETGALLPLLAGKTARDGRAAAYVCRRGVCDAPVGDAGALEAALAAGAA